ncbi:MAG: SPASM domain-containing protein, partial [Candidatus Omnitrophota bacterium]
AALEIGVGYTIQPENFTEIYDIAKRLKQLGVNYVRFRAAMEDEKGVFDNRELENCYNILRKTKKELSGDNFEIIIMYDKEEAAVLSKKGYRGCYAYSLIAIIGPNLDVYPCTHRSGEGKAVFGNLNNKSFADIWRSNKKMKMLDRLKPYKHCPICPPQAARVNDFLDFLRGEMEKDPSFLQWFKNWTLKKKLFDLSQMGSQQVDSLFIKKSRIYYCINEAA